MKLTNKEHESYILDKHVYYIDYETPYGKGMMVIKKSFWERCQKKFTKAMKDATITRIREDIEE